MTDLNMLLTLDALLAEGSVVRAARRLHLSPSAMSRALARLREATGDPLLVRAGRGLVPSPRAIELRKQVSQLVMDAQAVLQPMASLRLDQLERQFTLRTSDGFVENFGPGLIARVAALAPGVRLHFVTKSDKHSSQLRDGSVDLETGVVSPEMSPEIRTQTLFLDRFVGVVSHDHALCEGEITAVRYASGRHVCSSRRGTGHGPVDSALNALGLQRRIVTRVGGFAAALVLARTCELIATVPERHTGNLRAGLFSFALPVRLPQITVSLCWHPRMHADAAHRWLRELVLETCAPATLRLDGGVRAAE